MANSSTTSKNLGATPGKLALIGVLAVVLVGVLYMQFGGAGSKSPPVEAAAARRPSTTARTTPSTRRPGRSPAAASRVQTASAVNSEPSAELGEELAVRDALEQAVWKAPDIAQVVQYDPFAVPAAFPQPAAGPLDLIASATGEGLLADEGEPLAARVERMQTELEQLRQRGVRVIVKRNDRYAAMIGDRTLYVGDEINGFTVTGIDPEGGVRVERKILP